jgi:hypothetical protein
MDEAAFLIHLDSLDLLREWGRQVPAAQLNHAANIKTNPIEFLNA